MSQPDSPHDEGGSPVPGELPIDLTDPMAVQSRQTLMIANEEGWLTFREPFDMSKIEDVEALRAELGPDADLPTDDGVYYLAYLSTPDGPLAVLIPEGDPRAGVFLLAASHGRAAAAKVQYRPGMLPT